MAQKHEMLMRRDNLGETGCCDRLTHGRLERAEGRARIVYVTAAIASKSRITSQPVLAAEYIIPVNPITMPIFPC